MMLKDWIFLFAFTISYTLLAAVCFFIGHIIYTLLENKLKDRSNIKAKEWII